MKREYKLLKRVTMAGKKRPIDAKVLLDDRQSDWLAKQGAIAKAGISATPPVQATAAQTKPVRRLGGCGCGR